MEEILNRIANILNSNSEATIISLVVTAIAAFAAFITALASLFTVNINKKMLTRMQETELLSNQSLYPFLELMKINKELDLHGSVPADPIRASEMTCKDFSGTYININNGDLGISNKPFCYFLFNLQNTSEAIIRSIKLLDIRVMKPNKLEEKTLSLLDNYFSLNYDIKNSILHKKDAHSLCIQLFLDDDQFVKYFTYENIILVVNINIEIITGLKFYQQIVYDGGSTSYYCCETEKLLPQTICKESKIYIN